LCKGKEVRVRSTGLGEEFALLRRGRGPATLPGVMKRLTKQEQFVLCAVLGLLLVGLAVKVYRAGHAVPSPTDTAQK
jgi:hypothetical protein